MYEELLGTVYGVFNRHSIFLTPVVMKARNMQPTEGHNIPFPAREHHKYLLKVTRHSPGEYS